MGFCLDFLPRTPVFFVHFFYLVVANKKTTFCSLSLKTAQHIVVATLYYILVY